MLTMPCYKRSTIPFYIRSMLPCYIRSMLPCYTRSILWICTRLIKLIALTKLPLKDKVKHSKCIDAIIVCWFVLPFGRECKVDVIPDLGSLIYQGFHTHTWTRGSVAVFVFSWASRALCAVILRCRVVTWSTFTTWSSSTCQCARGPRAPRSPTTAN